MTRLGMGALTVVLMAAAGCNDDDDTAAATVRIHNDFDNPELERRPPWTICESSYRGVEFGPIELGETSEARTVTPGLDYVLMVASWDDPSCAPENSLPIASKNEEEVVDGQTRTIAINVPNHQGACPPEGVPPIPEAQYERILERWPDYHFLPYDERTENPECLPDEEPSGNAGAGGAGGGGAGGDAGGAAGSG